MICWRSLATRWTGWANRATSRQARPWTRPAPTRPTAIIMPSSIHGPEAAIRRQGPTEFITARGRRSSRLNNGAIHETAKSITVQDPFLALIIRPSKISKSIHHFFFFFLPTFSVFLVHLSIKKSPLPHFDKSCCYDYYLQFFRIFIFLFFPLSSLSKAGLECIDDDDDGGRQRAAGEEEQLYIFFPPLLRDLCNLRDSRVKGRLLWEKREKKQQTENERKRAETEK